MPIPNRELSQFGSFLYVDNTTRNIGIATTASPNIGIGTTNPFAKLTVIGDTNVSGVISATGYYLNGNSLVSAAIQTWEISGSDIYRNTGNVGIGSSIPGSKLTVVGDINATGTVTGSNISVGGISISSGIITASRFHSTVASGTAPFIVASDTVVTNLNASRLNGKTAPTGDIVGTTDAQTLTNKTINLANNSLTGTISSFNAALSDADFATLAGSETLTNKTLTSPVISSISNSGTQTVPTGTGTLVSTNSNGVVTSTMIANGTIVDADISASAAISVSKLASSTISGVSLGSNLNSLTAGSYITYDIGSTYNGSAAITIGVAGTSANTANTVVVRDALGDFTGGTITASDFNSTSDINLKENIETIKNSLETINSLRGVSFDWKETGKSSYGVIAQELEEVLPDLVNVKDIKSVNYNGLVGVLIEAVKELSAEVQELKNKLNN